MHKERLYEIGSALYGLQWKSDLARTLGLSKRTVLRYANGESPIPDSVATTLRKILRDRARKIERLAEHT